MDILYEPTVKTKDTEKADQSSVEIRLYNHKTGKVFYENLDMNQLSHILKVLDPKKWI